MADRYCEDNAFSPGDGTNVKSNVFQWILLAGGLAQAAHAQSPGYQYAIPATNTATNNSTTTYVLPTYTIPAANTPPVAPVSIRPVAEYRVPGSTVTLPAQAPMPSQLPVQAMPVSSPNPVNVQPIPGYVHPQASQTYGSYPVSTGGNCATGNCAAPSGSYGDSCGSPLMDACRSCGCPHPEHIWVRAEWLYWASTGGKLPALLAAGPGTAPLQNAAIPGQPGVFVLFGDDRYNDRARNGYRISLGGWFEESKTFGGELSFQYLQPIKTRYDIVGDGLNAIGASPFIDATTGLPTNVLISYPGLAAAGGSANYEYESSRLIGVSALLRHMICCGEGWRLDGLFGYRYLDYQEKLSIRKTIIPDPAIGAIPGSRIQCDDFFDTQNRFNGLAIGIDLEKCCGCWTFNFRPGISVGHNKSTVNRDGVTESYVPGAVPERIVNPGGTYNLVSNIGRTSQQNWTVVPELEIRATVRLYKGIFATAGYNMLYLPVVARAGNQIDPVVNPNLIPPAIPGSVPNRPGTFIDNTSMLFHGLSAGLEFRF
jgi:hypothetical protein